MDSFDAGFELEGESERSSPGGKGAEGRPMGELVPYDPGARDGHLEEIVASGEALASPMLVQLHEKVRAIEQAAEAQRYSKPALKRVVARRLMTEDQRLAADREQRAYEDMARKLGDWRETPLGATADPA